MKVIQVVLADDHALVRAGIRMLLQNIEGIEVIAEADDGHEALRLVEQRQPNVVILDIAMPGLNGLEVAARITKSFPQVRVIMLSMHGNEEYVLQALRAGATGYLLKGARTAELELAVRAVADGETYLSPAASKHVVGDYVQRSLNAPAPAQSEPRPAERLTPRQREILQLIAEGQTTKEIARTLTLSVKTVEMHRAQLMERLDIHDVAGLVRYAIRTGIVAPGD
jgi:DNA-binding NarL/FixJ family response regulator